jgi:putative RecB family exonuclease
MEDPTKVVPLALEREISVEVDGVPFYGFIDRIDDNHGFVTVVDIKTGKVPAEKYRDDKLLQLKFYAAALLQLGEPVHDIELLYVTFGERIGCIVTQSVVDEARSVLVSVWDSVNDSFQEWKPNPGPLCFFCDFQTHCAEGKIAAERYRKYLEYKNK